MNEITKFLTVVKDNIDKEFLVTPFGCGLGFTF